MKKKLLILLLTVILSGCSLWPFGTEKFEETWAIEPTQMIAPGHTFKRVQLGNFLSKSTLYSISSEQELALLLYKNYEIGVLEVPYISEADISLQRVYLYLDTLMVSPFSLKQGIIEYKTAGSVQYKTMYIRIEPDEKYAEDVLKMSNAVINSLIDDSMSDTEKIEVIHDYLVKTIVYDESVLQLDLSKYIDHPSFTAYGALNLKIAVCSGYARAFLQIMRLLDIKTGIVSAQSIQHAWNIVEIDGEWLYLDATWNDPIPDVPGRVLRTYFLQSRRRFLADKEHRFDISSKNTLDADEMESFMQYAYSKISQ
ncbi:MAG: transglutaminase domain-containing protein [Erysipelotrichaceae bacterium]|nr:transglutaminase domain-containing protein [Erysipelotrichaceae bacterium]MDP3305143.1 transglutaminase domain-containing protein [Erysipelotrichaceae bacterium]